MYDVLDDVEIALRKLAASERSIDITRLHRVRNRVEALWTRRVDEFDRNGEWIDEGFATAGAAIRKKCNMEPGHASHDLKLGRKLRSMPAMTLAFENGEVSREHVQVLADAMTPQRSAAMAEIESQLTELARAYTPKDFRQIVRRYTDALDGDDGARSDEKAWKRRRFHLSEMLDGMGRGDFLLNREDTQVVSNAPTHSSRCAAAPPMQAPTATGSSPAPTSPRSSTSRRSNGATPTSRPRFAPKRTLVTVCRRRRWKDARDGGCTHPGCDRPPGWCEIHHIVHWEDGGATSAENGKMVCRYHHVVRHLRDALGHDPP
jgi:Domain of unknown function (DUF222)/HNH endonuclease